MQQIATNCSSSNIFNMDVQIPVGQFLSALSYVVLQTTIFSLGSHGRSPQYYAIHYFYISFCIRLAEQSSPPLWMARLDSGLSNLGYMGNAYVLCGISSSSNSITNEFNVDYFNVLHQKICIR